VRKLLSIHSIGVNSEIEVRYGKILYGIGRMVSERRKILLVTTDIIP